MKTPEILSQLNPADQMVSFAMADGFFYCRVKGSDGKQKIVRQRWNAETQSWEDFKADSLLPRVRKPLSVKLNTRGMKNQEIANLFGVSVQTIVNDNIKT